MQSLGIDIGSRTIKAVLLEDGSVKHWEVADASSRPAQKARALLKKYSGVSVVATGYGRGLLEIEDIPSVTEIKACARGIRHCAGDARVVVDIGGQDLKVILLDAKGKTVRFEMNDRCAAGTGRFMEIMAEKLGYPLSDFGIAAMQGKSGITVSSLCTVFAESEVIGLVNKGAPREDIALAVHRSVIGKVCGMYKRLGHIASPIHLVGGGALNSAIGALLENELHVQVIVPNNPRIIVALGAACIVEG